MREEAGSESLSLHELSDTEADLEVVAIHVGGTSTLSSREMDLELDACALAPDRRHVVPPLPDTAPVIEDTDILHDSDSSSSDDSDDHDDVAAGSTVQSTSSKLVSTTGSPDPEDIEPVGEFEETTHIDIAAEISAASSRLDSAPSESKVPTADHASVPESSANTTSSSNSELNPEEEIVSYSQEAIPDSLVELDAIPVPNPQRAAHLSSAELLLENQIVSVPSPHARDFDSTSPVSQDSKSCIEPLSASESALAAIMSLNNQTETGLPPPIEVVFEHLKHFEQLLTSHRPKSMFFVVFPFAHRCTAFLIPLKT